MSCSPFPLACFRPTSCAWDSLAFFALAAITDGLIYQWLHHRPAMVKINASNLGSSLVDSIVFPTVAFGALMPGIVAGQFFAKLLGGFLWALMIGSFEVGSRKDAKKTEAS